MNQARRKQIEALAERARSLSSDIDSVSREEREYLDEMPESMQRGTKGDSAEDAIDALESASDAAADIVQLLAEAANS